MPNIHQPSPIEVGFIESLSFGIFDSTYLNCSEKWLTDPEVSALIDSGPFSKDRQLEWYASLPTRIDYRIWGVSLDRRPVGAVGLKGIEDTAAEYFGYLGDKNCWGKGLGRQLLSFAENQAVSLGLSLLRLRVLESNIRAIRLYQRENYQFCMRPDPQSRIMVKCLHPLPSITS